MVSFRYKWDIPVHYVVEGSSPKLIWFNRGSNSVSIPLQSDKKLIKLNHKQLGYYRVNYDVDTWMEFDSVLKSKHEVGLPILRFFNHCFPQKPSISVFGSAWIESTGQISWTTPLIWLVLEDWTTVWPWKWRDTCKMKENSCHGQQPRMVSLTLYNYYHLVLIIRL